MIAINKRHLIFGVIFLFLLQLNVVAENGMNDYIKFVNPFFVLITSLFVAVSYFNSIRSLENKLVAGDNKLLYNLLGALLAIFFFILPYEELRKLFLMYDDPKKFSDVIPQLEALYDRFANGEHPYYPVVLPTHSPFPVYLPINWLPIGIARYFHFDVRWVGILLLVIPVGLYGAYVYRHNSKRWIKILLILLPSLIIWANILPLKPGFAVTLETMIAAYYLVLAVGLASKNLPLTILGVILCLLSRYTLVFWLPLFAYLLWINVPKKYSIISWSVVLICMVSALTPFFVEHPDSLIDGLIYHNNCAVADMAGYGDPPVSWTHESGIYFAPHFKALINSSASYRVTLMRAVQALFMIGLNVLGVLLYRKWKHRVNHYEFSLGFLFLFMLLFYLFSPLAYRYYYIPMLYLSTVLVATVCIRISNAHSN